MKMCLKNAILAQFAQSSLGFKIDEVIDKSANVADKTNRIAKFNSFNASTPSTYHITIERADAFGNIEQRNLRNNNAMKTKLAATVLLMLTFFAFGFKIDDTPLEKLLKQLAKITATYPQEKVHLHLDKPYYAIGEDIWLKAYLVTAEKNEPSLLSKVLYVDLISENNEIKKKLTMEVDKGFADGSVRLIDSLKAGNYRIRAYTNYMKNYDASLFFEKFITIGDVVNNTAAQTPKEKKLELSLQFFPEGGNLVNGVRSKIGIKAVSANGMGANLTGYVENKNKEKVAIFTIEHAGMGVFALMPKLSDSYIAVVTLADGTVKSFNLPKVLESGFALAINQSGENISVRISGSANLVDSRELYVVAQSNGKTYASFASKFDQASLSASIPSSKFPTGIVQFTLFDAQLKPVAERLIFVNHNDELKIGLKESINATAQKKTAISLQVTDQSNTPIDGNFSVSVTDASKIPYNEDDETTILSNLLLTSDLKGYIEQPNYYFNEANPDRKQHLDHLLLTQGWRRFAWQDIVAQKEPDITYRPEQSLEITGKITGQYKKPLEKGKVSLISTTPGLFMKIDTISDSRGNFVFDRLDVSDSAAFVIQAKSSKDSKFVYVTVNSRPDVAPYEFFGNAVNITAYLERTKEMFVELDKVNKLDKGIMLKSVNISAAKPLKPLLNVPNSTNASGAADYVISAKMLTGAMDIFSPFYKAPGVLVKNGMIYRTRASKSITANPPMLLIIDGVQVNQAMMPDYILGINPADVEGIEILTSDYNTSILGPDATGGAVYITTRKGGGAAGRATNVAKITGIGYNSKRIFYSPNYDDPKIEKQAQDLRSTIYWNPNVLSDDKGIANFSFFNASTPSTYKVTIEGMDAFGNIGRKTFVYEVKLQP